ncbi:hypothetical protein TWF481_002011 [Arthrobotrys musiformis]|uniref:AttH domain-containing protein n=1 Tax=Arthrobotrys musiformis TaxID=47236 RepID=A0AAV9VXS9_9PEZI
MGLFDRKSDHKGNEDNESIYSVDSKFSDIPSPKNFHIYYANGWKSIHKIVKYDDKTPAYFAEFHYSRPSSLRQRYVSLHTGENNDGPLVAQMGSNMMMSKFHFRADGQELEKERAPQDHTLEQFHESKLTWWYNWTDPNTGKKMTWKNTSRVDIEDGSKKSKMQHGWKLVDENDQVVGMFVWCRGSMKKLGKFIMSGYYADASLEFERSVLVSCLGLLQLQLIAMHAA